MNGVVARSDDEVSASADFAAWVTPSLLAMTRLARRLAPDVDADDVVQDALVRAWRKRRLYDPGRGTATTWLLAITADRARAARRSRHRRLQLVDDTADVPEQRSDDPDGGLDAAIATLAPRQRLAVELHYYLGLSVAECAAVMSCSDGTVKSTLFDARANLRKILGADDAD